MPWENKVDCTWKVDDDRKLLSWNDFRRRFRRFLAAFLNALVSSSQNVIRWFISKPYGRRRRRKFSVLTGFLFIYGFFYVKLNVDTHNTHELDSAETPVFPCERTAEEANDLRALFHDVHEILNDFEVRHFLIYGSIWGAYRSRGPLPWDYDIDLGINGDDEFSKIPREKFAEPFKRRGIRFNDKTSVASVIYLSRGKFAQVDLDIFYNYRGWMQRSGWIPWVLYYNYKSYHTFPSWMVQEPLPTMRFIDINMSVPRGGKTILKYLYPKDWERPFTPAACKVVEKKRNNDTHPG